MIRTLLAALIVAPTSAMAGPLTDGELADQVDLFARNGQQLVVLTPDTAALLKAKAAVADAANLHWFVSGSSVDVEDLLYDADARCALYVARDGEGWSLQPEGVCSIDDVPSSMRESPQHPTYRWQSQPSLAVSGSLVPFGLGLRAYIPVGESVELFLGASGAVAVFESGGGLPARLRVDTGLQWYLAGAEKGFFVGAEGAWAGWSEVPWLGGTNVAGGPMIGTTVDVQSLPLTVGLSAGVMLHHYYEDYSGSYDGDGFQVLPQTGVTFRYRKP